MESLVARLVDFSFFSFFGVVCAVFVDVWCGLDGGNSQSQQGDEDDEGNVKPVDMLVPVLERDGLLGDVWLLEVVLLSTGGLVVDSAIWDGLGLGLGRWCGRGHGERVYCCEDGRRPGQASLGLCGNTQNTEALKVL